MNETFDILFNFVRFDPKFNRKYSWLNHMLDLGIGKAAHVILCLFALILFWLVYCFIRKKYKTDKLTDLIFICVLSGIVCSLIDKIFWDGSLDYIQFKGLFTFDLKDVYLTIFEVALIAMLIFNYRNIRSLDQKRIAKDFKKYIGSLIKKN